MSEGQQTLEGYGKGMASSMGIGGKAEKRTETGQSALRSHHAPTRMLTEQDQKVKRGAARAQSLAGASRHGGSAGVCAFATREPAEKQILVPLTLCAAGRYTIQVNKSSCGGRRAHLARQRAPGPYGRNAPLAR